MTTEVQPTVNGKGRSQLHLDQETGTALGFTDGNMLFSEDSDHPDEVTIQDVLFADDWTVEEMREGLRRDGKLVELDQIMSLMIRSAPWSLIPVSEDSQEEQRMCQELTDDLQQMDTPMDEVIGQMTSAFAFRRSHHEKVYTRIGSRIGYSKVAFRPQESCEVIRSKKRGGQIIGFKQTVPDETDPVRILNPYALTYVHGIHREPIRGQSALEIAYQCYQLKWKIKFLWYNFLEGQNLPRTIVFGNSETGTKNAVQAIARLKSAGVAGVPKDWVDKIQPLDVSGKGAAEFKSALDWLDSEASGSILAGFTTIPGKEVGSYAMSKDQTDFFVQMQNGNAREMGSALRQYLLADVVRLNYGVDAPVPMFNIGPLQRETAESLTSLLSQLATAATDPRVPLNFIEQLTVKIAGTLDMDLDSLIDAQKELREKLESQARSQAEANVAQMRAGVEPLMDAAAQGGVRDNEYVTDGSATAEEANA